MALKTINDTNLSAIAAAIREKNQTTTTYKPSEMADAIKAISTGGGSSGGITQWGKLYYSSSTSRIDLSSIVSDYSKIDFIITLKNSTTSNFSYIYFPGLKSDFTEEYIPLLYLTTSNSSYYSVYSDKGYFVSPNDYTKEATYYFKKSEFEANQPLSVYYRKINGTEMEKYPLSTALQGTTSVLVFYHD